MRRPLILAAALFYASCMNPVHDDAVEALGGEVRGIPRGPTHRAGQPCLTCHGGDGPGEPDFVAGGTIYAVRGSSVPAPGVSVKLTDARGSTVATRSNQVGNFYVLAREWSPVFPLTVTISDGADEVPMQTPIGRDAACASCHRGTGDAQHMPGVYVRSE